MMPTNQIKILQARFMNTPINTQVELSGYMGKAPLLKIYDSGVKRATLILYTYLYHTDPAGKQSPHTGETTILHGQPQKWQNEGAGRDHFGSIFH